MRLFYKLPAKSILGEIVLGVLLYPHLEGGPYRVLLGPYMDPISKK